jgi:hypothetical protein
MAAEVERLVELADPDGNCFCLTTGELHAN